MAQSIVSKVFRKLIAVSLLAVLVLLMPVLKVSFPFSWSMPMANAASQNNFRRPQIKGDDALMEAYRNGESDLIVEGNGKVEKLLPDDLKGSKHQKFILRLASGQSIL